MPFGFISDHKRQCRPAYPLRPRTGLSKQLTFDMNFPVPAITRINYYIFLKRLFLS